MLVTGYFGGYSTERPASAATRGRAPPRRSRRPWSARPNRWSSTPSIPGGPTAGCCARPAARAPRRRPGLRGAGRAGRAARRSTPRRRRAGGCPGRRHVVRRRRGALFAEAGLAFPAARTVHDARRAGGAPWRRSRSPWCSRRWAGCTSPTAGESCWAGRPRRGACGVRRPGRPASTRPRSRSRRWRTSTARRRADRRLRARPRLRAGRDGRASAGSTPRCWTTPPARWRRCRPAGARRLLLSLRGAPLLTGVRGGSRSTSTPCAAARRALSPCVAAAHPELAELEVNPLLAGPPASSRWTPASCRLSRAGDVALDVAQVALVEARSTQASLAGNTPCSKARDVTPRWTRSQASLSWRGDQLVELDDRARGRSRGRRTPRG